MNIENLIALLAFVVVNNAFWLFLGAWLVYRTTNHQSPIPDSPRFFPKADEPAEAIPTETYQTEGAFKA